MRTAAFLLSSLIGVGACTGSAAPPSTSGPPVPPAMPLLDRTLAVAPAHSGVARSANVESFAAALAAAAAVRDAATLRRLLPESPYLEDWLSAATPDRRMRVDTQPIAEVAGLRFVRVALEAEGGHLARSPLIVDVALDAAGTAQAVTLGMLVRAADATPVARIEGEIYLDPRVPWTRGEITIELVESTREPFVLWLPGQPLRVDISQAGHPCPFTVVGGEAVVTPIDAEAVPRYLVRFEGPSSVRQDGSGPRSLDGRLAMLPGLADPVTAAEVDVTVHHPRRTRVVSPLPGVSVTSLVGWRSTRFTGRATQLPIFVAEDQARVVEVMEASGGTLTLEASPAALPLLRKAVEQALDTLAPLGAMPDRHLRLIALDSPGSNVYHRGLIVITRSPDDEAVWRYIVTHELVHLWFVGAVPIDFQDSARWWEAVAELVATWGLSDSRQQATRAGWLERVARLPPGHERATALLGYVDMTRSTTLSYARAALVLAGLEARVGRAAMVRWLRALVETRRGRRTDLQAFIASVGPVLGVEEERWLRSWLLADTTATASLEAKELDGGRLKATLTVSGPMIDEPALELCFMHRGKRLSIEAVSLAGAVTEIDVAVPSGATTVVLGCRATLPLLGLGDGGDLLRRLVFPLPGSDAAWQQFIPDPSDALGEGQP